MTGGPPRADAAPRAESLRIDKWLWHARFLKTRVRAAAFVENRQVRLSRPGAPTERLGKPSQLVRVGDVLSFAIGSKLWVLRIAGLGTRRGPAREAQALYVDLSSAESKNTNEKCS